MTRDISIEAEVNHGKKKPRNQRKTPKSGEPKRAAVYVDELLPIEERQQELVNILRNVVKNPEHYDGIIVYGSPATDVKEHVKDAIALLAEHGTEVTLASREPAAQWIR